MSAPGSLTRWNWAVAALVIALVGMMLVPPPAMGQAPGRGQTVSAVGPAYLVSITPEQIVLTAARKPFVMDVKGKRVVAQDANGNELSLSAITAGMYVIVSNRDAVVTIRVAPRREVENNVAM